MIGSFFFFLTFRPKDGNKVICNVLFVRMSQSVESIAKYRVLRGNSAVQVKDVCRTF